MDQRIPLGAADSPHAVRRLRRLRRFRPPLGWPAWAAGVALASALVGVWLETASPAGVEVALDAEGYHIAGQVLEDQGDGSYQDPSGAALIIQRGSGRVLAAASTNLNGRHMLGRCVELQGADHEDCTFTIGGATIQARDDRTSDGWHRRYEDGQTIDIRVTGGADTPVPFAVGR